MSVSVLKTAYRFNNNFHYHCHARNPTLQWTFSPRRSTVYSRLFGSMVIDVVHWRFVIIHVGRWENVNKISREMKFINAHIKYI